MKKFFGFIYVLLILISFTACSYTNIPADEEVKLAYEKATEAYTWFDLSTMPLKDNSIIEYNGKTYQKVDHNSIKTLSDLETYLHRFFSDDIVNSLIEYDRYVDIDGDLYAIPADRGTNIYAGEEYHEIIHESDEKIIYQVTVDILGDNFEKVVDQEVYSFAYEFLKDQWVFTNFSLVR